MNKKVYAVFDKQKESSRDSIVSMVDYAYEATEHGIENVVLNGIDYSVLLRYGEKLAADKEWPSHLSDYTPNTNMTKEDLHTALFKYFKWGKGNGSLAGLVVYCSEDEMPAFVRDTIYRIAETVQIRDASTAAVSEEPCEDDIL